MNTTKKFHLYITIFLALLFLGRLTPLAAQNTSRDSIPHTRSAFKDRIFVGGNLGVQFGTVTLVDVSPLVGYRITDRLNAAVGIIYQYYHEEYYQYKYSTHIFGGRTWLRYYIFQGLFAHAEYELLNYDPYDTFLENNRISVSSYLLGGGYTQWIGGSSFLSLTVLWDLNESPYSIYQNPIFQVGFGIGL
ncbi:MAG TPA: hypothetical protein PKH94_09025 [Bacteroidales bacterium]|nr:hypothetical protein [Bacteroidales bacterium]HNS47367.1 hypothetical protein [Bacteroidales bacterium]